MKSNLITLGKTTSSDVHVQTWATALERETSIRHNDAYKIPVDEDELPIGTFCFDNSAKLYHICLRKGDDVHNKVMGFIMLSPSDHDKHVIWLSQLYIDPAQRGKGIGTRALKLLKKLTQKEGYKVLGVDVWVSNTAGKRLYEKIGFDQVVHETKVMYL